MAAASAASPDPGKGQKILVVPTPRLIEFRGPRITILIRTGRPGAILSIGVSALEGGFGLGDALPTLAADEGILAVAGRVDGLIR